LPKQVRRQLRLTHRNCANLYERQEVDSYLAPLLSRATKVGFFEMHRYRLAHREGTLTVSYFCLLLCVALLVVSGTWHLPWAGILKRVGAG